jgi:hypothetical protein
MLEENNKILQIIKFPTCFTFTLHHPELLAQSVYTQSLFFGLFKCPCPKYIKYYIDTAEAAKFSVGKF